MTDILDLPDWTLLAKRHDERPCFTGTDADRNVIGAALTDIDAARGPGGR